MSFKGQLKIYASKLTSLAYAAILSEFLVGFKVLLPIIEAVTGYFPKVLAFANISLFTLYEEHAFITMFY